MGCRMIWRSGNVHEDERRRSDECGDGVPGLLAAQRGQEPALGLDPKGPRRSAVSQGAALFRGSQHHLAGLARAVRITVTGPSLPELKIHHEDTKSSEGNEELP